MSSSPPHRPGLLARLGRAAPRFLVSHPGLLRKVFWVLRGVKPILVFRKLAIVARHADVVEALQRDDDFIVGPIYAANLERLGGRFLLGMDRSEEYDRESRILRQAVHAEDLETIRGIVTSNTNALIDAARPTGRIDVVGGLSRVVATRVVADYFGVPGPDEQSMMRWLRAIFYDVVLNLSDDHAVTHTANTSATELSNYVADLIVTRKKELADGCCQLDDILTRLLRMQSEPATYLDDDGVRRNIQGLIVGAVDLTATFVAYAFDELLRRRDALSNAPTAALSNDFDTVAHSVFEALRFKPHAPLMARFCPRDTILAAGTKRKHRFQAGTKVYLGILSAMFDPSGFPKPGEFRLDRSLSDYLHFGNGIHMCFGRHISGVQVPEVVKAIITLNNLRRARGSAGKIAYDGPFPDRLVVAFD